MADMHFTFAVFVQFQSAKLLECKIHLKLIQSIIVNQALKKMPKTEFWDLCGHHSVLENQIDIWAIHFFTLIWLIWLSGGFLDSSLSAEAIFAKVLVLAAVEHCYNFGI